VTESETDEDRASRNTNHYLDYAAVTARNLGAERHTISVSGIGLVKSWWAENMPNDYYWRINCTDSEMKWDFSRWVPDVIVVNLGQNDSWLGTTKSQAVQGYIDFVRTLRSKYNPDVHIILALGSMDMTMPGSPWPGYVETAVSTLKEEHGDSRVYSIFFPYSGINAHPHAEHNAAMAVQLTSFIRSIIDGAVDTCATEK